MPCLREVAFRLGTNTTINWNRPLNQEALLAYTCGTVAPHLCKHCEQHARKFQVCVFVLGWLGQSCAGCHYGSKGSQCSFQACGESAVCHRHDGHHIKVLTPCLAIEPWYRED